MAEPRVGGDTFELAGRIQLFAGQARPDAGAVHGVRRLEAEWIRRPEGTGVVPRKPRPRSHSAEAKGKLEAIGGLCAIL